MSREPELPRPYEVEIFPMKRPLSTNHCRRLFAHSSLLMAESGKLFPYKF